MSDYRWLPNAEQFPKKNALTAIGAMSFGIFTAAVIGAVILRESALAWVLLAIGSAPLFASIWGFIHFAKNDPDRLQTEDYRIQRDLVAKVTHIEGFSHRHLPPPDAPPVAEIEDKSND
jgi:hypothetical protein